MNKSGSDKAIFLLGLKHSGKSTIAKMLASPLGRQPVDTDELVANLYLSDFPGDTDKTLSGYAAVNRHFYRLKGQELFWEMEARALQGLSEWGRYVIATGGGMMENAPAMEIVRTHGLTIFLNAPEELLFNRIARNGIPPFLDKDNPEKSFHELYLKRTQLVRNMCDIEINNGYLPVEMICELVLESLEDQVYGR